MVAPRIVVVGSTMTDLVAYADRLPEDGETLVGREFATGFGGKGANQAVMAARLGADVAMVGAVGEDAYGAATLANLEAETVRIEHMVRVPGASGVAPIWVDGAGRNRIIIIPGANLHVPPALGPTAIAEHRPQVVVGQFEIPQSVTATGFAAARAAGVTTVLNPAPGAPIEPELLALTDWLVPNETEFAVIDGVPTDDEASIEDERIRAFATRAGVGIVVTLGAQGAALAPPRGSVTRIPARRVTAVDTTGAGDAFVGGFAVGLALGWPPVDAAALGCATASDSVTRPGTQRAYADRARASAILQAATPGASR